MILGTHNFLLKNLDPRIAGFWRNCDVWIGGKRKIFISTQLIEEDIKNLIFISEKLLAWAMDKNDSVKEEVCKILHIAFEKCHPFSDGNGRVFRLIMNWQRIKLNIPILLIKADWPQNDGDQKKYYSWFKDGGSGLTEYIKENNIKL